MGVGGEHSKCLLCLLRGQGKIAVPILIGAPQRRVPKCRPCTLYTGPLIMPGTQRDMLHLIKICSTRCIPLSYQLVTVLVLHLFLCPTLHLSPSLLVQLVLISRSGFSVQFPVLITPHLPIPFSLHPTTTSRLLAIVPVPRKSQVAHWLPFQSVFPPSPTGSQSQAFSQTVLVSSRQIPVPVSASSLFQSLTSSSLTQSIPSAVPFLPQV